MHGIMASFGAHAAWDFNTAFELVVIPWELDSYALHCLRKRTIEKMAAQGNVVRVDAGETDEDEAEPDRR